MLKAMEQPQDPIHPLNYFSLLACYFNQIISYTAEWNSLLKKMCLGSYKCQERALQCFINSHSKKEYNRSTAGMD